eukprot:10627120-Prorocentrum_lima.AAC.1
MVAKACPAKVTFKNHVDVRTIPAVGTSYTIKIPPAYGITPRRFAAWEEYDRKSAVAREVALRRAARLAER